MFSSWYDARSGEMQKGLMSQRDLPVEWDVMPNCALCHLSMSLENAINNPHLNSLLSDLLHWSVMKTALSFYWNLEDADLRRCSKFRSESNLRAVALQSYMLWTEVYTCTCSWPLRAKTNTQEWKYCFTVQIKSINLKSLEMLGRQFDRNFFAISETKFFCSFMFVVRKFCTGTGFAKTRQI